MLFRRGLRTESCSQALASSSTAIDAADDDIRPFTPLPLDLEEEIGIDGLGAASEY